MIFLWFTIICFLFCFGFLKLFELLEYLIFFSWILCFFLSYSPHQLRLSVAIAGFCFPKLLDRCPEELQALQVAFLEQSFLKCVSRFVIPHACIVSVFIQGNKLDIIKYKGDLLNPKKMMHVDKPPNK